MKRSNRTEARAMHSIVLFVPCYIGIVALCFSGAWLVAEPAGMRPPSTARAAADDATPVAPRPELVVRLASRDAEEPVEVLDDATGEKEPTEDDGSDKLSEEWPTMTETVEHGVLVVRHGPVDLPKRGSDESDDLTASDSAAPLPPLPVCALGTEGPCVCGLNSPLPCDPLLGVRGPAEGFHKDQPWAYHPLSMKYHPSDFTYTPKTDWTYKPKTDWTYTPKTDWTYHRRLGVRRNPEPRP